MKRMIFLGTTLFLASCTYTTSEVVEYQEVVAAPIAEMGWDPAGINAWSYPETIDVTTTTITYY